MGCLKLLYKEKNYTGLKVVYSALYENENSCTGSYRYGFNTQEKDDEVYGKGNLNTAMFWEYDTRLGRRWNQDQIVKPWESRYATFADNPIYYVDPLGLDVKDKNKDGVYGDQDNKGTPKELPEAKIHGEKPKSSSPNTPSEVPNTPASEPEIISTKAPEIKIETNKIEEGYFDVYFKAPSSGEYGPYNPDAVSFSVGYNLNTFFGSSSINCGIAIANNDIAVYYGGSLNFKLSYEMPSLKIGGQFNLHDNYGESDDVIDGLEGYDRGYNVSAFFGGGASYTANKTATGDIIINKNRGVQTTTINIGVGWGVQTGGSYTKVISMRKLLSIENDIRNK